MGNEKPSVKAGWYAHPSKANTLGYWDGAKWTDQLAPAAPGRGARPGGEYGPRGWAIVGLLIIGIAVGVGALADDYSLAALLAIPGELLLSVGIIAKGVQVGIWASRD